MRILPALAAIMACLVAAPAYAAGDAELSMMDDQALLGASQARIDAVLGRMVALGAERLRVSAYWSDVAPAPHAQKRPDGFNPRDTYDPAYRWDALDRVVGAAAARGLRVMISLSTPAPYWGSGRPELQNAVWAPDKREFADFAFAAAARYRAVADQFAILNEPNQGAWLQPQSRHGRAVAPHLYRAIVRNAYPAVKEAAPGATVLIGELASSGRDDPGVTRPIRPLRFLRLMGCRDARYHRLRKGPCIGFRPVPADAIGMHPYALFQSPYRRSIKRDDAAIGDWRRLESTLDRLVRARAIKPSGFRRLPIYYTEFGYQTDPPDPFAGIPLRRQDRWLQEAAYVAWRTPRIRGLNQFRVSDGHIRGKGPLAFREFQSGLWFANGKPKPSARSFPNPIVRRGSLIWGQARPGGRHTVTIERRAPRSKAFRRVRTVRTDAHGYFHARVAKRRGAYRFRWSDDSGRGISEPVFRR
jgi:hypothetical protein